MLCENVAAFLNYGIGVHYKTINDEKKIGISDFITKYLLNTHSWGYFETRDEKYGDNHPLQWSKISTEDWN